MTKIATTGISSDIVVEVVNANGGNANHEWKNLCGEVAKYRKWARFKPRRWPADVVPVGDANASPQSWRASDGWCGLTLPVLTTLQAVKGLDPEAEWKRNPPTGGTDAPCRIDDYGGYNSDARHPIKTFIKGGSGTEVFYIEDNEMFMLLTQFFLNDNRIGKGNDDALDLTDFAIKNGYVNMTDAYFGVVITKADSNFVSYVTQEKTLGEIIALGAATPNPYPYEGGLGMGFNITSQSFEYGNQVTNEFYSFAGDGEYNIYAAMFVDRNAESNGILRGTENEKTMANGFVPLPISPITINVVKKSSLILFSALSATVRDSSQSMGGGTVYITFRIYNNSNDTEVVLNGPPNGYYRVGVRRYWNDGSHDGQSYMYATQSSSDPITIPPQGSVTVRQFYIGYVSGAYNKPIVDENGYQTGIDYCKFEVQFGGSWGGASLSGSDFLEYNDISVSAN